MIAFPSLRINFGLGLLIPTFTKVIQTLFSSNLYIEIDILLGFFYFLWFIYIGLLVFYTKLTHLAQKFKKNLD